MQIIIINIIAFGSVYINYLELEFSFSDHYHHEALRLQPSMYVFGCLDIYFNYFASVFVMEIVIICIY